MAANTDKPLGMSEGYNDNSRPQLEAVESTIQYAREAIQALDIQHSSFTPFIIADFGSAHGRNSMHIMKLIIQCLKQNNKIEDEKQGKSRFAPPIHSELHYPEKHVLVVHNDLPTNDWSILFDLLNQDNSYYNVASGRSFYEPSLPPNSLSIGYSSTSLHWLSRKPCNISNHCASLFAQGDELKAFQEQARLDWIHFLEYRSNELLPGGVLILLIPCVDDRGSNGFDIVREFLYTCARSLLTSQELLDYTLPIHARSYAECVDEQLFTRYCFELIKSDVSSVKIPFVEQWKNQQMTLDEFVRSMTLYIRSWSEPILKQTLLINNRSKEDIEQILDQCWLLYGDELRKGSNRLLNLCMNYTYLILKKKKKSIE